ncbi:MAG TPA: hypothetical protein DEH22_13700 [Chloroflexi bacterium]|nr:hypothetical protein [Chloroflexota bacterium]
MRTIRRLYLYGVAIISLMVVVWGLIGLARSAFAGESIGGDVVRLAGALSLIFVGVPVFLLHWWLAQKSARNDEEERFSRARAFFLYGALLATLIPIVQNAMALVARVLFGIFNSPQNRVVFGYGQTWSDNLIAIVMNGLIAAYVFNVLRSNWEDKNISEAFWETRRLYRLVWLLYGLILTASGVQQILLYFFDVLANTITTSTAILANGLTLTLVGVPVWIYSWRILQKAFEQTDEQQSLLRPVVLYVVRLITLMMTLFVLGAILYEGFNFVLGDSRTFTVYLDNVRDAISILIPAGLVWLYYSSVLRKENKAFPNLPYRAEMQRLYAYIAAFLGLVTVFVGLNRLLYVAVDALPFDDLRDKQSAYLGKLLREGLSLAFAMLIIGLPLWLKNWLAVQKRATSQSADGEQAQRSLTRKIYLYLILFMAVIGMMVSAGMLLFQLLQAALGAPEQNFAQTVSELLSTLVLFAFLLGYHGWVLRGDNRLAAQTIAARHAEYPVLVLVSELGAFSDAMVAALQKETPTLPVAVHVVDRGAPDETLSNARAVILPASIAAYPLEAIRLWVQNFSGVRFVIPTPVRGWVWVSGNGSNLKGLIQHTAEMVRKLAEGDEISKTRSSPWIIVGYIAGGLLGFIMLMSLFSMMMGFLGY